MSYYVIYADGGSSGNPGPAYGSYEVQCSGQLILHELRRTFGIQTNNVAEYMSAIRALNELCNYLTDPKLAVVVVRMDSALVVNQSNGPWKVKQPHLIKWATDVANLKRHFSSVTFERIPREQIVAILGH